jgi:Uncharacterized alpha/beta hydrolase domain (DUF2235)
MADGTGNAFLTQESNIWRIYQSLDSSDKDQVACYIQGVGTSTFKPWAIFDGATGRSPSGKILLWPVMALSVGAGAGSYQGYSGNHMLAVSSSHRDPRRTLAKHTIDGRFAPVLVGLGQCCASRKRTTYWCEAFGGYGGHSGHSNARSDFRTSP